MQAEDAIRGLITAIDRYLESLDGEEGREGRTDIRAAIARASGEPYSGMEPATLPPVEAHFKRAVAVTEAQGQQALAKAFEEAAPHLTWVTYNAYDPVKIGPAFGSGHAFASLIGEASVFYGKDFELGIFLIAPHTFYRDHHHPAPELYAPVTGPHGWRFGAGTEFEWRDAHLPVWNEANRVHATMTGEEPFLCIFGWTKDVRLPAVTIPSDDWDAIDESLADRKGGAKSA